GDSRAVRNPPVFPTPVVRGKSLAASRQALSTSGYVGEYGIGDQGHGNDRDEAEIEGAHAQALQRANVVVARTRRRRIPATEARDRFKAADQDDEQQEGVLPPHKQRQQTYQSHGPQPARDGRGDATAVERRDRDQI